MLFLKDIALPLLVAGIAVGLLSTLLNVVLRLFRLDITIIKIILFFAIWYFIGPILYQILVDNIIVNQNEILEFIYKPIQVIMGLFNNLL